MRVWLIGAVAPYVVSLCPGMRRQILDQGSAEGDVDDLQPATDRHGRHLPRVGAPRQLELELVPLVIYAAHRLMPFRAVPLGSNVATAREEETVDVVEDVVDGVVRHGYQDYRESAAACDRICVRMGGEIRPNHRACRADVLRTT